MFNENDSDTEIFSEDDDFWIDMLIKTFYANDIEFLLWTYKIVFFILTEMAKLSLKDTEPATEEKSPMPVVKKNGTHHLVLNGKWFATVSGPQW